MTDGVSDTRSRLARMLGGALPFLRVEAPTGRLAGLPVALRALSSEEIQTATRAAYKSVTDAGGADYVLTDVGEPDLALQTKLELLAVALVEAPAKDHPMPREGYTRLVSSSADLAKLLDPEEIDFVWNRYLDHQKERSPISHAESWEEVREAVLAMGKGTIPTSRLSGFDASSLRTIVVGLAKELATLTRPSSSTTSPSNAPGASGPAASSDSTRATPGTSDPSKTTDDSPEATETGAGDTALPPAPGTLTIR